MSKKQTIKRAAKRSNVVKSETNEQAHKKVSVNKGGQHNCRYCPPFEFENKVARKPKRGAKKPKSKNKRG
jgi:Fe-S cluster assembly iron-binding protein IscA